MTLEAFFFAVLAGMVGTLAYNRLARKEASLRAMLAAKRAGWRRRRYVRVFVQAVRGEANVADSRGISNLLLAYPIAAMVFAGYLYYIAGDAERQLERNLAQIAKNREAAELVREPVDREPVEQRLATLMAELDEIEADTRRMQAPVAWARNTVIGLTVIAHLWYFYFVFVRHPFVVFRARFSHELARMMTRLQYLASKGELAELIDAEAGVGDEASANKYVQKMTAIARRHSVEHLVAPFQLWGP